MRWLTTSKPLIILLALGYYTRLAASFHLVLGHPENFEDKSYLDRNTIEDYQYPIRPRKIEDERLEAAMKVLIKLLILPWPSGESPLIYIESPKKQVYYKESKTTDDINGDNNNAVGPTPSKRMRYYRKYPWKRENMGYDPENPFVCYPSKLEVHSLLVALHDTRYGYREAPVDFCSRKRPAHTILTNMHFSGK